MPLGHLVDLVWRWKSALVCIGAALITASLLVMVGLLTDRAAMEAVMSAERWFILSALLGPVGYVIQDVVADAMTVEAVPRVDARGNPVSQEARKLMNTTMQTLGRFAVIGGLVFVALLNISMFAGVETMSEAEKIEVYGRIYLMALAIPALGEIPGPLQFAGFALIIGGLFVASWRRPARQPHQGEVPADADGKADSERGP